MSAVVSTSNTVVRVRTGDPFVWTGTSWATKPIKVRQNGSWKHVYMYRWDGQVWTKV